MMASKQIRGFRQDEVEALFLSLGEGAIATDTKGRISRINQKALDILGYKQEELVGKWFQDALKAYDEQEELIPHFDRPITQAFITGQNISTRCYYASKSGEKIAVFLTVSPIMVDNVPVGAVEVFRDITEEKALEKAKDEFVAIASHQLRTPATAVKQYLGLLLEGYAEPLTDNQRLFLERAYESNERQLNIVQEILKITQLDLEKVILKPSRTDVAHVIKEAIATVSGNFKAKRQKIIFKPPPKPIFATIDQDQIRVAIENLLENASNYTWEGKSITVSATVSKGRLIIKIEDEGVGIAQADMPKLFQKFSRIPNSLSLEVSGTGLGLYWAAKIVQLHGGVITVSSKPGSGSCFSIDLPV